MRNWVFVVLIEVGVTPLISCRLDLSRSKLLVSTIPLCAFQVNLSLSLEPISHA